MTLDEMDKRIEFILQMQAQFESNLTRSETNIDNLRVSISDLRVSVGTLAGVVRDSIKISDDRFTRHDDRLNDLIKVQKAADERAVRLDHAMIEMAERLNALIGVVEGHITGPDHATRP